MLPSSRNTNYTPGAPVKSADLNDIQDAIISGKRGSLVRHLSPHLAVQRTGAAITRGDDYIQFAAATATVFVPLTLTQGEKITELSARVQDSGADSITMKLFKSDLTGAGTGVVTQIGATQTSVGAAGLHETLSLAGLAEVVGSTHFQYWVEFVKTGNTSGGFLTSVLLTTDVP